MELTQLLLLLVIIGADSGDVSDKLLALQHCNNCKWLELGSGRRLNQKVSAIADKLTYRACGLPLIFKRCNEVGNNRIYNLKPTIEKIKAPDKWVEKIAHEHLHNLTKPTGSLGYLEDIAAMYCRITDTEKPSLGKKRIYTFAADHGVVSEGVTCYPKDVTRKMALNMLAGGAGVNVLSRHSGAETVIVDIGVDYDFQDMPGLISRKVLHGTDNMAEGPAMTEFDAIRAIEVGIELAQCAYYDGVTMLGTGEMGIGNTTPSSALLATLLPCDVEKVTGRGAGISDDMLRHKTDVIKRSMETNKARLTDPISTLAAIGGLEIAGIAGLCIGGAAYRIPVVVDGFISSAGALVACEICGKVKDYLFFSHLSQEQGHSVLLEKLGARPILDLDMRLGEGTGAALAMNIIEAAIKIYNEMATFENAGVTGDKTK